MTKIRSQKHMFRSREDIFRYPTAAVRTREDMDYISREFEDIFQYVYNKCLLCHTLHVCNNRIGNLLWTNMSSTNSQDEKPRNIIPIVSEYNRHCATSLLSAKLHHSVVSANFFAKLFHYLRMFGRTDEFWKIGFSVFEAWYLCAWDAKNCNSKAFRKISI